MSRIVSEADVRSVVSDAAARFSSIIIKKAGGQLPSLHTDHRQEWFDLARSIGFLPVPLEFCPWSFTARLEYDSRHDLWLWVYNRNRTAYEKACYFCHEAGEYLCLAELPAAHEELNRRVYNYTGSPDPSEIHHRVGCEVERLLMDKKRTGLAEPLADIADTPANAAHLKELELKVMLFRDQIALCHHQIESMDKQIESLDKMRPAS